jgi:Telomere capping, CST complex subunit
VDVSILVDSLRFSLGDWVNVIGWLESGQKDEPNWIVRAIMVWPVTPGFSLIEYEDVVKSRIGKSSAIA